MTDSNIDPQPMHKQFSVACFNSTWELIDKQTRTDDENITMLLRTMASLWHWTQRADCTPRNLSIGYWQVSRVLSLLGQGELAKEFGNRTLQAAEGDEPFYLAYGHEAIARATALLNRPDETRHHLAEAHRLAASVADPGDREVLLKDLQSLAVEDYPV